MQEGWLSASGTLRAKDASTLELSFDKFWVDFGSTSLRPTLTEGERMPYFACKKTLVAALLSCHSTRFL